MLLQCFTNPAFRTLVVLLPAAEQSQKATGIARLKVFTDPYVQPLLQDTVLAHKVRDTFLQQAIGVIQLPQAVQHRKGVPLLLGEQREYRIDALAAFGIRQRAAQFQQRLRYPFALIFILGVVLLVPRHDAFAQQRHIQKFYGDPFGLSAARQQRLRLSVHHRQLAMFAVIQGQHEEE